MVATTISLHDEPDTNAQRTKVTEHPAAAPAVRRIPGRFALTQEQYFEVVDQFAHDVRSPHCVISEYASLVLDGILSEGTGERDEAMDTIRTRVAELQIEIDALLMTAKLSCGRVEVELEKCDAARIVEQAFARLDASFKSRQIAIRTTVDSRHSKFDGDADLARTALVQLLWSILQVVPSPSDISVAVDRNDDGLVRFRLAGSAMRRYQIAPRGIAAQAQMAVKGRKTRRQRIDISLGVAWELAELMHGKIVCGDDSIELPAVEFLLPARSAGATHLPRKRLSMGTQKRILIVDDDRIIVRGLELRLAMAGYETIAAYDGSTALQAAATQSPDAILIDRQLGHEDGLSILKTLREQTTTHSIPIVLISGQESARRDAVRVGADAFLGKPYHGSAVLALLDQLTGTLCAGRTD